MELRVDDYGYDINFTVKDSAGVAVNLTGVQSILFRIRQADGSINLLNGTCSVVSATAGTCKYTVLASDFNDDSDVGNYVGALVLVYSASKKVTTKDFAITIKRALKLT
jgi:hypothetical protein